MEISLDKLIAEINQSQKSVVNYYLFGPETFLAPTFTEDNLRLERNEQGHVFFPIPSEGEDAGYFLDESYEIYQEVPDEGAKAKFEVREQGLLLLEIRLY